MLLLLLWQSFGIWAQICRREIKEHIESVARTSSMPHETTKSRTVCNHIQDATITEIINLERNAHTFQLRDVLLLLFLPLLFLPQRDVHCTVYIKSLYALRIEWIWTNGAVWLYAFFSLSLTRWRASLVTSSSRQPKHHKLHTYSMASQYWAFCLY